MTTSELKITTLGQLKGSPVCAAEVETLWGIDYFSGGNTNAFI